MNLGRYLGAWNWPPEAGVRVTAQHCGGVANRSWERGVEEMNRVRLDGGVYEVRLIEHFPCN